jgi:oxysterol-binding protein-related protein 9/10/11
VLPPKEMQLPHESLRLWDGVTQAILARQYSKATAAKVELEERQRVKARERERTGEVWQPIFFEQVVGNGGQPILSEKGKEVIRRAQKEDWSMEGIVDSVPSTIA